MQQTYKLTKNFLLIIVLSILTILAAVYSGYKKAENRQIKDSYLQSDFILESESYIKMVYIGSSTCRVSNQEAMHQLISNIKLKLSELAKSEGFKFITTGIAIDMSVDNGIKFLENSGNYDQVITGLSWFNMGAYTYIWNNFEGMAVVPQLLITISDYKTSDGLYFEFLNIDEKVLLRRYGYDEISKLYSDLDNMILFN